MVAVMGLLMPQMDMALFVKEKDSQHH